MQKKIVFILMLFVFLLCGTSIFLLRSNLRLRQALKETPRTERVERKIDLRQHRKLREDLKRDLEEKYRADMVSYRVMIKRLEQEKKRQKELEEKLEELKKKIE